MDPIDGNGKRPATDLEAEFPLGDGTAAGTAEVSCPHCGAASTIALDPGSGSKQEYMEDCPVCCRPWQVAVRYGGDGSAQVKLSAEI